MQVLIQCSDSNSFYTCSSEIPGSSGGILIFLRTSALHSIMTLPVVPYLMLQEIK